MRLSRPQFGVRSDQKRQLGEGPKLAKFERAVLPHLNAAYNLARWLMRNEHDAEDVVQEAYLRAFRFFGGFDGGDGRAWLLAIVRNVCWTSLRRAGGQEAVEFNEEKYTGGASAFNPEVCALRQASIDSVRRCIEELPPSYREVIVMRELEELSYKEIAESACVPVGTVMSRLARARARLQNCLSVQPRGAHA